ncbi:trigger factor [Campylobacter sp. CCS1377]|uniref:Trigger factor n=1 Tax=Campylobacter sp. CCS1377 TaxID=3158229 RepID=A0AAU7E7Y0_9BACT|nr:trigger factor [Campylobacter jejuni]
MEVKAKQLDSVNATASVKIPASSINAEVEKLAKQASKTVKMDGFRTGHVPVAAVLKRYAKQLNGDAERNLFRKAVSEALKELKKEGKDLVGDPYFEKFNREKDEINVEIALSFKPDIKLEGYEKFIPEYSTPKVTKKEIDTKKEDLLKSFATLESVKKARKLKEGDFAKFDFEGFVDGKAFEGGKAQNYILEIGSKQFIPGFEEGMIGLKPEEEKDIEVTFPKEYGAEHLAGKAAVFKVKLHEIQELKIPELNDEMLKKVLPNEKEPTEEILETRLKEQIKNEKLFKLVNEELKPKFADALIENFDFDIPRGIVEQETDIQFRNAWNTFSEKEIEELKSSEVNYQIKRDSFKEEAKKSVKLTFIIDELAKLRGISVSDQELVQAVYFEAYRFKINPKEHLENYKKQGALPALKMALIEDRLFSDIFLKDKNSAKESEK